MTDEERIILTLSDPELLMFHQGGGTVPRLLLDRLASLLAENRRQPMPQPRREPAPPVAFDREALERRRAKDNEQRRRRYRRSRDSRQRPRQAA